MKSVSLSAHQPVSEMRPSMYPNTGKAILRTMVKFTRAKPRICRICNKVYIATVRQIQEHAETCHG